MEKPSTSIAVWISTVVLHKENPTRESFQANEIFEKVRDLDLARASEVTISMHISLHCVANSKAAPNSLRFLFRVRSGWYRLFRKGDEFHESRKDGRIIPKIESMPKEYLNLLDWYENIFNNHAELDSTTNENLQPYFARIDENNSLIIPRYILNWLKVKNGDHIAFLPSEDKIILKKAKVRLEI